MAALPPDDMVQLSTIPWRVEAIQNGGAPAGCGPPGRVSLPLDRPTAGAPNKLLLDFRIDPASGAEARRGQSGAKGGPS
jgi:hypothetical protein